MGSGVAKQVKELYPDAYNSYRRDYLNGKLKLGYVNFVKINSDLVIANMCSQDRYGFDKKHTDYDALQKCLNSVKQFALNSYSKKPKIAFPYLMSCCRGGGNWNTVYSMIEQTFQDFETEIWKLCNH